jgi:predicted ATPase
LLTLFFLGRIDPIRIELKDDSLGIGKAEEYQSTHIITTAKRKALDSEKQLEETDAQKMERQFQVEKKQAIAKELEQVKRAFYCELCDKQYKQISEYEQHLQSYDHHHKKVKRKKGQLVNLFLKWDGCIAI